MLSGHVEVIGAAGRIRAPRTQGGEIKQVSAGDLREFESNYPGLLFGTASFIAEQEE